MDMPKGPFGNVHIAAVGNQETVYNFITELYKTKNVSDATFGALKDLVGERGVVDIIVTARA